MPKTHQVTQFKGSVVGRALGPLNFKWLQRMFSVPEAELTIYPNVYPFDYSKPVAKIKASKNGDFEFPQLQDGAYALHVHHEELDGWFSFELDKKAPPTIWITIDISPLQPDCSGGHYVKVTAKK